MGDHLDPGRARDGRAMSNGSVGSSRSGASSASAVLPVTGKLDVKNTFIHYEDKEARRAKGRRNRPPARSREETPEEQEKEPAGQNDLFAGMDGADLEVLGSIAANSRNGAAEPATLPASADADTTAGRSPGRGDSPMSTRSMPVMRNEMLSIKTPSPEKDSPHGVTGGVSEIGSLETLSPERDIPVAERLELAFPETPDMHDRPTEYAVPSPSRGGLMMRQSPQEVPENHAIDLRGSAQPKPTFPGQPAWRNPPGMQPGVDPSSAMGAEPMAMDWPRTPDYEVNMAGMPMGDPYAMHQWSQQWFMPHGELLSPKTRMHGSVT